MAYRFYHYCRRWDEGRKAWFWCYRFPFNVSAIHELKARIPRGRRFWYPDTKAWHIGEKYADLAEEIISQYTHLGSCPGCERNKCRAWSHLDHSKEPNGNGPDPFSPFDPFPPKQEEQDPRWFPPIGKPDTYWALRIFGLPTLPSGKDLKALYRKLAVEFHPDLNPNLCGDSTKMALINSAKDYLDRVVSW